MQVQRPLHLGKCPGKSLAATGVIGPVFSHLFYVSDVRTHTSFLLDTGSEVSAIPPSASDRRCSPDALTLSAVNNTPMRTYGKRSLTLNVGLRRPLPWIFIIADVQKPIIGADFFINFSLLVDIKQHQLIDATTCLHIQGILSTDPSPTPSICPKDTSHLYYTLLSEFPALTQVSTHDTPVKHDIVHHIETTGA